MLTRAPFRIAAGIVVTFLVFWILRFLADELTAKMLRPELTAGEVGISRVLLLSLAFCAASLAGSLVLGDARKFWTALPLVGYQLVVSPALLLPPRGWWKLELMFFYVCAVALSWTVLDVAARLRTGARRSE